MNSGITILDTNQLDVEAVQRGRVNMIRRKRLPLESGVPGVTIECSLSIVPDGYFTPRHRHNFDQIRYTLTGVQSTGHGDLAPGEIGYFPEGSYYGPQAQKGECVTLVLQFQGASGEHLLSNEEMNATYQKMIAEGAIFQDGIYRGKTASGGKKNKDSYVAIWEEHEGKKLAFPKGRYRTPVMMQPQFYSWLPDRERQGVETKHLGTFNEMRTGMGFFRLLPGATLPAETHTEAEIRYIVEGSCRYDGKEWGEGTYLYLPPGVRTEEFTSEKGATFFYISLPLVNEFAARQRDKERVAAE
jgi:quercetin dioxygenase-like cupin family protein